MCIALNAPTFHTVQFRKYTDSHSFPPVPTRIRKLGGAESPHAKVRAVFRTPLTLVRVVSLVHMQFVRASIPCTIVKGRNIFQVSVQHFFRFELPKAPFFSSTLVFARSFIRFSPLVLSESVLIIRSGINSSGNRLERERRSRGLSKVDFLPALLFPLSSYLHSKSALIVFIRPTTNIAVTFAFNSVNHDASTISSCCIATFCNHCFGNCRN